MASAWTVLVIMGVKFLASWPVICWRQCGRNAMSTVLRTSMTLIFSVLVFLLENQVHASSCMLVNFFYRRKFSAIASGVCEEEMDKAGVWDFVERYQRMQCNCSRYREHICFSKNYRNYLIFGFSTHRHSFLSQIRMWLFVVYYILLVSEFKLGKVNWNTVSGFPFFLTDIRTWSNVRVTLLDFPSLLASPLNSPPNTKWQRNQRKQRSSRRGLKRPSTTAALWVRTWAWSQTKEAAIIVPFTMGMLRQAKLKPCTHHPETWLAHLSLHRSAHIPVSERKTHQQSWNALPPHFINSSTLPLLLRPAFYLRKAQIALPLTLWPRSILQLTQTLWNLQCMLAQPSAPTRTRATTLGGTSDSLAKEIWAFILLSFLWTDWSRTAWTALFLSQSKHKLI